MCMCKVVLSHRARGGDLGSYVPNTLPLLWFQFPTQTFKPPIHFEENVAFFMQLDDRLYAFDLNERNVLWSTSLSCEQQEASIVHGRYGILYVGCWGSLYAINQTNGSILWFRLLGRIIHDSDEGYGCLVDYDQGNRILYDWTSDRLYVTGLLLQNDTAPNSTCIMAFNATTTYGKNGTLLWSITFLGNSDTELVLHYDHLHIVSSLYANKLNPILYAFNGSTGSIINQVQLSQLDGSPEQQYLKSGPMPYLLYVINVSPGLMVMTIDMMSGIVRSNVTINGFELTDFIYVEEDSVAILKVDTSIYTLDPLTSKILSKCTIPESFLQSSHIDIGENDLIYVVGGEQLANNGAIYVLRLDKSSNYTVSILANFSQDINGNILTFTSGGKFAVYGRMIYILDNDYLTAISNAALPPITDQINKNNDMNKLSYRGPIPYSSTDIPDSNLVPVVSFNYNLSAEDPVVPVEADEKVFSISDKGRLYALNMKGTVVWISEPLSCIPLSSASDRTVDGNDNNEYDGKRREEEGEDENKEEVEKDHENGSSDYIISVVPANLTNGYETALFVSCSAFIYRIAPNTGKIIWKKQIGNSETGTGCFMETARGHSVLADPIRQMLYVSALPNSITPTQTCIMAIDFETLSSSSLSPMGSIVDTVNDQEEPAWIWMTKIEGIRVSPMVLGSSVLFVVGATSQKLILYALGVNDGAVLIHPSLPVPTDTFDVSVDQSLVISSTGEYLYHGILDGGSNSSTTDSSVFISIINVRSINSFINNTIPDVTITNVTIGRGSYETLIGLAVTQDGGILVKVDSILLLLDANGVEVCRKNLNKALTSALFISAQGNVSHGLVYIAGGDDNGNKGLEVLSVPLLKDAQPKFVTLLSQIVDAQNSLLPFTSITSLSINDRFLFAATPYGVMGIQFRISSPDSGESSSSSDKKKIYIGVSVGIVIGVVALVVVISIIRKKKNHPAIDEDDTGYTSLGQKSPQ